MANSSSGDSPPQGLGSTATDAWPKPKPANVSTMDWIAPGTEAHKSLLDYLVRRLESSERQMVQFYDRWRWNEKRVQAYIDLPKYEQLLKEANRSGEPPKVTSIVMPYAFATISTIVTYLIQALAGRKPMFQVGTNNDSLMEAARTMELMLQYNADHVRLIAQLFQFLTDGEMYGVSVFVTGWRKEQAMRTKWIQRPKTGWLGLQNGTQSVKIREKTTTFEGTSVKSQDPFMFFPDPRVPMAQVNKRGEFVFWRTFEGKHTLKLEEAAGRVRYVDNAPKMAISTNNDSAGQSSRSLLSNGDPNPGLFVRNGPDQSYYQIDQGSVWIIPAEVGLGESTVPEMWIFSIANKGQIIQAEPLELDHGMHPVCVSEPYTMGYGFGQPGLSDYLGPVQDTISWFLNSHIHNVRTAINNMFVVDPSMIEMQDLKNPGPGKFIRLKRSAFGRDVKQALSQLPVTDITRGHIADLDNFLRIGDSLAAVNDNLRGLQDAGGRKSATEARTSAEAAASRLASHAKLISSQALIDLAEQMSINYQQNLSDQFLIQVIGEKKAAEASIRISPESLTGDFTFPVNDGTLPLDRVALLDVWKEIMQAVMQDQELRQSYSVPKLFAYVADLGGAKNLDSMKLMPNAQVQQQVQAGNLVPTSEMAGMPGMPPAGAPTPGVVPNPGDRMAGGL